MSFRLTALWPPSMSASASQFSDCTSAAVSEMCTHDLFLVSIHVGTSHAVVCDF